MMTTAAPSRIGETGSASTGPMLALNRFPWKFPEFSAFDERAITQKLLWRAMHSVQSPAYALHDRRQAPKGDEFQGGNRMQQVRGPDLTVAVDLMSEPCLWRWEIRDPSRDEVVANSWTNDWMAYESSDEALRAAQARLTSLVD